MKDFRFLAMTAALALAAIPAQARVEHLLPRAQSVELGTGTFAIGGESNLTDPTECELLANFVKSMGTAGKPVTVSILSAIEGAYDYQLAGYDNEAYRLTVTPEEIRIEAVAPIGVIRATQTLMQLAEDAADNSLEAVTITDWPAFKLRGFMHDVGRSFITADELVHEIELMSRFKVNTFHWHLTENQAWRFEVKAYPQLTSASSMTRFAG
ncbi:MAG: family 20 glycosylhydrolase, partial [Muribaculaceae bacterium]|nr:family 20 glycosylhydrolase [Muribaculaceae bacterium]